MFITDTLLPGIAKALPNLIYSHSSVVDMISINRLILAPSNYLDAFLIMYIYMQVCGQVSNGFIFILLFQKLRIPPLVKISLINRLFYMNWARYHCYLRIHQPEKTAIQIARILSPIIHYFISFAEHLANWASNL